MRNHVAKVDVIPEKTQLHSSPTSSVQPLQFLQVRECIPAHLKFQVRIKTTNRPSFLSYAASSLRAPIRQPCQQQRLKHSQSLTTMPSVCYSPFHCSNELNANVYLFLAVFSKSYCPYCKASKKLLSEMGAKAYIVEMDQIGQCFPSASILSGHKLIQGQKTMEQNSKTLFRKFRGSEQFPTSTLRRSTLEEIQTFRLRRPSCLRCYKKLGPSRIISG